MKWAGRLFLIAVVALLLFGAYWAVMIATAPRM